jgi:hypothetical protein
MIKYVKHCVIRTAGWTSRLCLSPLFGASTLYVPPNSALDCGLVEEPNDLSSNMFPSRLFMIHDSGGSCHNNVTELTRWQKLDDPLLQFCEADVVAGRDDTSLIQAT